MDYKNKLAEDEFVESDGEREEGLDEIKEYPEDSEYSKKIK